MTSIETKLIGAKEISQSLKNAAKTTNQEKQNMSPTVNLLRELWKKNMPVYTGFMKESTFGVVEGEGRGKVFTMTFLKKEDGYAIFPELGTHPGHTKPGFTKKTVEEFAQLWEKDLTQKIDEALK